MFEKIPQGPLGQEESELVGLIQKIEGRPENKRIDPREFSDLVDPNEIENDVNSSVRLLGTFQDQASKLGESEKSKIVNANFVETMIPEAVRRLRWLGRVEVIKPSLYDDFIRHIDVILQIKEKEISETERDLRCMGVSIDFTISPTEARENVLKIAQEIQRGYIPSAKYFKTSFRTKDGEKEIRLKNFKMPRVVVACDRAIMEDAKAKFVEYEYDDTNQTKINEAKECNLRYIFIYQIMVQLEYFGLIAKQAGNNNAYITHMEVLEAFKRIIRLEGIDTALLQSKTRGDHAFKEIIGGLAEASSKSNPKR